MPRRRWVAALVLATITGVVLLELHGTAVETAGAILLLGELAVLIGLIVVRLGPQSRPDREREAQARESFDRTGEWPAE